MISPKNLSSKSFAIYGFGATGKSVINYFEKKGIKKISLYDDSKKKRKQSKYSLEAWKFKNILNSIDYIVISPGINFKKTKFKKKILENKNKIVTDLDLFYLFNPKAKTIVVTGTNGKSTTCKIIEHILKKNKLDVKLGGNIGQTILNLKVKKKTTIIIEASSFQLAYSKFIKPTYAILLNISNDHLDWHGNKKNYVDSKFKIFSFQKNKDFALIEDKNIIKRFKKEKKLSKLEIISSKPYQKIKHKILNKYLLSKANENNMPFIYKLSKIFKLNKKSFIKYSNTFKGLEHRHEIVYKKKNIVFINDSKATSFEACKYALQSNKNIFWILGGLPKIGDKFRFDNFKKNIIKSFIIGKHVNFFKKQIENKINFQVTGNIKRTLKLIFNEIKEDSIKNLTVLLSPASASYDQYKNFNERGLEYKKLVKFYAKRYL
jgi:UDP-N-acetylmuramoylalanine--D-glutamate ligase|tara:strand:- start:1139 stop:2437 length:1299 start_codon:yes stop_codon:yes gene_type:complete